MNIIARTHRLVMRAAIVVVLLLTQSLHAGEVWRQSTFDDFSRGYSDDGGVNLYAAADGTVRTIYTFDYNRDGANDILIISGHDNAYSPPTYIYINDKTDGFDKRFRWLLLANGTAGGVFADLDGNGYQDVILCGTSNGANFVALDAVVYYGSERGYSTRASTRLPTYQSTSVAVLDCDNDGSLDLVFAQGHRPGLVIYYNGPDGLDRSRKHEVDCGAVSHCLVVDYNRDERDDLTVLSEGRLLVYLAGADGVADTPDHTVDVGGRGGRHAIADLDGDGNHDLVVSLIRLAEDGSNGGDEAGARPGAMIHWGDDEGGFSGRAPTVLPGVSSRDVTVADFNRDGRLDIAMADFGEDDATGDAPTLIYWADAQGYDPQRTSRIETRFARAITSADLDGDGWPDLVIACYRDDASHNVDSYIYYNRRGTFSDDDRVGMETLGAVNIATGDADHDGRTDVMFLNAVDGTNGLTDSAIYWNDGSGRFGPDHVSTLEARDPFTHVATDVNLDGYLDMVLANSYEYARYREQGSYIYWGNSEREADWSPQQRSTLPTNFATGVVAGDFNKDGWLDLAFAQIGESIDDRVAFHADEKRSPVFWGSADGYHPDRVTWLPVENPRGLTTGDLNKDGWLDLIYTNLTHDTVPIFWGSPGGFSADNRSDLAVPGKGTVCVNTADVNDDGWLDLLFSCFYDYAADTLRSDRLSYLFPGSPDGFDPARRIGFQTMAPTQSAIADFNKDGLLDIFFPNYANTHINRTWSSYLYYNGTDGFAPGRRTSLFTESGSYGLALDFNADGWLDLAVGSHMQGNGNHRSHSSLYYGGQDGFSDYQKIQYPTNGSHELTSVDPGHIYHRRFEVTYYSCVHDAGQSVKVGPVSWVADTPHGSRIRFELRCAESEETMNSTAWQPVNTDENIEPATGHTPRSIYGRYIQYRATFLSNDGSNYPVLRDVAIELE